MSTICLVDTSVFLHVVKVPKTGDPREVISELEAKIRNEEKLFLPLATIWETGNHIGHILDGDKRHQCATFFKEQIEKALNGESPFTPIKIPSKEDLSLWLADFPSYVTHKMGFGDLSIIKNWEELRNNYLLSRVYIWSLDTHLQGYDTGDPILIL